VTRDEYIELYQRFQFGPDRVLRAIFALDDNVQVLMTYAAARGERCRHWIFTFKDVDDLERCVKDWGTFLRRLRAKTGVCGLRVFEWGRKTGRFHVHVLFDRWIDLELVNRLKADLPTMGHAEISKKKTDENLGRYLWKELSKQFRHRKALGRRRLWATFGRLAGFVTANDLEIVRECWVDGVNKGDDWKECKRLAWETRLTGESRSETWKRALWLYWHQPRMNWGEKQLAWLEKHGPWVDESEESGESEHGDAYEDGGGDTDFDVGKAA